MNFDTVASELYGLLPEDFAAGRKTRAGEAQAEGNRDLATAIRQLRRPTRSAWLANLLVRERPTEISNLLELGAAILKAQSDLAGGDIRRLSQLRQQVVASLGVAARQLAYDLGKEVNESTIRELEETLDAATANSAARDALTSGRLTSAMKYSGFGGFELSRMAAKPSKHMDGSDVSRSKSPPADLEDESAAVRTSPGTLARAEREAAKYARKRQVALEEVERCNKAITHAEDLLRSLRGERAHAHADLERAERALNSWQRQMHKSRERRTTP